MSDQTRTVKIDNVEITLIPEPYNGQGSNILAKRHYQRIFDAIQDDVVRELYSYGIDESHISMLSANLTRIMMNKAIQLRCL